MKLIITLSLVLLSAQSFANSFECRITDSKGVEKIIQSKKSEAGDTLGFGYRSANKEYRMVNVDSSSRSATIRLLVQNSSGYIHASQGENTISATILNNGTTELSIDCASL